MNSEELQNRVDEVREQIDQSFQMLHNALYRRQGQIVSELDEVAQIHQGKQETEENGQEQHDEDEEWALKFFAIHLDSVLREIREFGTISMTDVDPNHTSIEDRFLLSHCPVGEDVCVDVHLRDCQGRNVKERGILEPKVNLIPRNQVQPICEVVMPNLFSNTTNNEEENRENNNEPMDKSPHLVTLRLRLPEPGEFELSVLLCELEIHGSPYTLVGVQEEVIPEDGSVQGAANCESIFKIGSKGIRPNDFGCPISIHVSDNQRVLITDSGNACVQVFSESLGNYITCFGPREKKSGRMSKPWGLAETSNGHYLVTDIDLRLVLVFDLDGRYVSCFGQKVLLGPRGICVDKFGRIIVCDNKDCSLVLFKGTGKFLKRIGGGSGGSSGGGGGHVSHSGHGGHGSRTGGCNTIATDISYNVGVSTADLIGDVLLGPVSVTTNSQGHILVTDFANDCIKVFNKDGEYLRKIGCHGEEWGEFKHPTGICCDGNDDVIVADWGNNRVQIFNSNWICTNVIKPIKDPLSGPQGVAVSKDNSTIFVVDSGNHCYRGFCKNL